MSAHHPPITCREFKEILSKLGFTERPNRSGTSHVHFVAMVDGQFRKVTVDCPQAPFTHDLIGSMAKQAGVTKKVIYDVYFGRWNGVAIGSPVTVKS